MEQRIKDFLKRNNAVLEDVIITVNGDTMIYYKINGDYSTNIYTRVFY